MRFVRLHIINDAFTYANDSTACKTVSGADLFELVQSIYPKGLPLNTYLYHDKLDTDCDITPKSEQDIDCINELDGTFYLVTYPADPGTIIAIVVSVAVSAAVAFLMPKPEIPSGSSSQPPSPNNALVSRGNRQRLGGRVPDIFGEVWAYPDLIAPTYSVYIDHKEVEYAYMTLGMGEYAIKKAYDDTTPIGYINGATVSVFNPGKSFLDAPDVRFGSHLSVDENTYNALSVKRYGAVNGQVLPPPNNYLMLDDTTVFTPPNLIKITGRSLTQFKAGGSLLIESATELPSAKQFLPSELTAAADDADAEPPAPTPINPYNLNGNYTIESVTDDGIVLSQPERVASDWERLTTNDDSANGAGVVISTEEKPIWEGWFYTDLVEHDQVLVNLKAPNGLYISFGNDWEGIKIHCAIESEIVDDAGVPIADTLHTSNVSISSPKYDKYVRQDDLYRHTLGRARIIARAGEKIRTNDDDVRRTAAVTVSIDNPHFSRGKKMRWRIRRITDNVTANNSSIVQEVRIADCLGVRRMTDADTPPNVTLVATKTLATEGALSLKERKLKLLVQRKLRDCRNGDVLMLSNRIDDIIYNIATDRLLGGMTAKDINMSQISAEIDRQIAYFGTDKCSEFCGTFDNTNITSEEMIQTVAQAGFCQAYRLNNQIHLHFEGRQDYAVVQFNSHNILPDSYSYSESFGARNNHDGVQVTYTDPVDDAKVTLDYPNDKSAQNPQKVELVGVRNKVQAHMHLMRTHHKNQLAYKSCEFTGADESGIVIPTNRIDVASQFNADVVQGVVERLDTVGGQIVATVSEPVDILSGTLFVQTVAGVVDNIKVTCGNDAYTLILARMPSQSLSLGYDSVVQATFKLVSHSELDRDAYIVSSKDRGENPLSHKLTCINYTDKYYQNDDDLKKGLISL